MPLDALEPHHLADLLPQGGVPLTGAVLHRAGTFGAHQFADRSTDHIEREARYVRHTTGERYHLGPTGHGEERPDLRGSHALGTRGVPVHIVVESRGAARHVTTDRSGHSDFPSIVVGTNRMKHARGSSPTGSSTRVTAGSLVGRYGVTVGSHDMGRHR